MDWVRKQIDELEVLARRKGLTMSAVCRMAGYPASLYSRWKSGQCEPTMFRYRDLWETIHNYNRGDNEDHRPRQAAAEKPQPLR